MKSINSMERPPKAAWQRKKRIWPAPRGTEKK